MANSRSAAKRVRKALTQTARNRVVRKNVKLSRKKVATAIADGDAAGAEKALQEFSSVVDKAASKNILHKHAASRQKSVLGSQLRALASA